MDLKLDIIKTIEYNEDHYEQINWYAMADEFDFFEAVGNIPDSGNLDFWEPHYNIDKIVSETFKANRNKAIEFFQYISKRYDFEYDINLEEYINEKLSFEENEENKLKLFISYATKKKDEANEVLKFFEEAGLDCFISNKLKPSKKYKDEIFNAIFEANIFIFILNKEFKESDWCSQEAGMAYLKYVKSKTLIFCIIEDGTIPYGFLNSFNGKHTHEKNYLCEILEEVDDNLGTDLKSELYIKKLDKIISNLVRAKSYSSARSLLDKIVKYSEHLTQNQLDLVISTATKNDQIYKCIYCVDSMKTLIDTYVIDKKLIDAYYKVANLE